MNGILHPKLNYRYRVLFVDKNGCHLSISNALAHQIISVGSVQQERSAYATNTGNLTLTFEDDVLNTACDAIQKLFKLESFNILVQYMDGNDEVVRTHKFEECNVLKIKHPELDYAGYSNVETKTEIRFNRVDGIQELTEHPIAAALIHLAENMRVSSGTTEARKGVVLQKEVLIWYKNFVIC